MTMGEVAMYSKAKRETDNDDYFVARTKQNGLRFYTLVRYLK